MWPRGGKFNIITKTILILAEECNDIKKYGKKKIFNRHSILGLNQSKKHKNTKSKTAHRESTQTQHSTTVLVLESIIMLETAFF